MTTTTVSNDPWAAAENAQLPPQVYFGEVVVDVWFCVLEKGTGKRPFDPQKDDIEQRRTAVDIAVIPLAEHNLKFNLERKMIAESKAWTGITWPSLRALGLNSLKELNGKWAQVTLEPTGRKWTNKNGEEKEETALKFLALYDSLEACQAAFLGQNNGDANTNANAGNGHKDEDRETALQFAKVIVENAKRKHQGDDEAMRNEVAQQIANFPLVSKYFSVNSPEVARLMEAA